MKKLLTIALIALTVSASAQKLTIFDKIEEITKENHTKLLPSDYALYSSESGYYTYQSPAKDVLTFKFDGGEFVSLTTLNPKLAGNIHKYGYTTYNVKGEQVSLYAFNDKLIQEARKVTGAPKWVFYSVNRTKRLLAE